MQDKLQEITQKIYQEGVDKANKEANDILANAHKKADDIIKKAKEEAENMKNESDNEISETKKKVHKELKQASHQTLRLVKQEVTNLIVAKAVDKPVKESFQDSDFMKKVLEIVMKKWDAANPGMDTIVLLPKDTQKELVDYFESAIFKHLDNSIEIVIERENKAGFKVGPADGSYLITFKEEDFENLFKSFLTPKTTKILFEEE